MWEQRAFDALLVECSASAAGEGAPVEDSRSYVGIAMTAAMVLVEAVFEPFFLYRQDAAWKLGYGDVECVVFSSDVLPGLLQVILDACEHLQFSGGGARFACVFLLRKVSEFGQF